MRSWCFLSNVSKKFQKEKAKYLKAIYPIPSKLIKRGSDEGKSILLKISVKRKKRKNNAKSLFLRLFPVFLAQRRGFEPPVGFRPTHDFQSCSFDQLGHLSASCSDVTSEIQDGWQAFFWKNRHFFHTTNDAGK